MHCLQIARSQKQARDKHERFEIHPVCHRRFLVSGEARKFAQIERCFNEHES